MKHNNRNTMKTTYHNMSVERMTECIFSICEEYGSMIDYDCQDEIIEKFFDDYDGSYTLGGMTKLESQIFHDTLSSIVKTFIGKMMTVEYPFY